MSFASDNAAGAHPRVIEMLGAATAGPAASYGADPWTARAEQLVRAVFEAPQAGVFLVATGTAANGLALAATTAPWAAVLCTGCAHIHRDEGGAPEFLGHGLKLLPLAHGSGRLEPAQVEAALSGYPRAFVHGAQPRTLSLTNATEAGTVYDPDHMARLGAVCRTHGLALHVDGARFANALAGCGARPHDLAQGAGVDVLSLGLTKAGALACEIVVAFSPDATAQLGHLRKRAGHLVSKHRLLAAQAVAMLEDGLWLDLARHANAMAGRLAAMLARRGAPPIHPVEANEVFVRLPETATAALRAAGIGHYGWAEDGPDAVRLVTTWATTEAEIAALDRVLAGVGAQAD
jgi:threonine aldolase